MSAPTVDAILDQIRALPDDQRDLFERRLRASRLIRGMEPPAERTPAATHQTLTVDDVAGSLSHLVPANRRGATHAQLRAAAARGWVEREGRFRADHGLDR